MQQRCSDARIQQRGCDLTKLDRCCKGLQAVICLRLYKDSYLKLMVKSSLEDISSAPTCYSQRCYYVPCYHQRLAIKSTCAKISFDPNTSCNLLLYTCAHAHTACMRVMQTTGPMTQLNTITCYLCFQCATSRFHKIAV